MLDDAVDHNEPEGGRGDDDDDDDEMMLRAGVLKLTQKQLWARKPRDCCGAAKVGDRLLQQSRSARSREAGNLHGCSMINTKL